ncbi:MAG TPA: M12 family metallo-peptidase [Mycobacteriales bacterium]|nr:M12 family metallo-peptidase [Mycobacteriales bacterium]
MLTSHGCEDGGPPQAASPPTALSRAIDVNVLLLLDGVTLHRATEVSRLAAQAYAPVGIRLRFTSRSVRFASTQAPDLFDAMRLARETSRRNNRLPEHHVLHLLTTKDVRSGGSNPVGVAACIGGIESPDSALSLSEVKRSDDGRAVFGLPALTWEVGFSATIFAHEVGHLFGARHEYGNCLEGGADAAHPTVLRPCTLMTGPGGSANARRFGTLEAAVVRGYAEKYVA